MKTFHDCLMTLLFSWGSDAPPEAIWAANDFLEFLSPLYPQLKELSFIEDDPYGHNSTTLDVIKKLGI